VRKPQDEENALQRIAQRLLQAVSQDSEIATPVDGALLKTAESLIKSHQLYVQVLFIDLIISRMKQLQMYFDTLDTLTDEVSSDDIVDLNPGEKVKSIQILSNVIRSQLETVNSVLSAKETSGVLLSSLHELFPSNLTDPDMVQEANTIFDEIENMSPAQRQRVLKGVVQSLRNLSKQEAKGKGT
jgi:hypothetical protein